MKKNATKIRQRDRDKLTHDVNDPNGNSLIERWRNASEARASKKNSNLEMQDVQITGTALSVLVCVCAMNTTEMDNGWQ